MIPLTQPERIERYVVDRQPGQIVTRHMTIRYQDFEELEDLYALQYVIDARPASAPEHDGRPWRVVQPRIPGRNSPCPCGSGKRYKDCHGAIAAEDLPTAADAAARASQYRAPDPEWTHLSADQQDALGVTMEAALAHQTAGRPDEAAKLYREALKNRPEDARCAAHARRDRMVAGRP